MVIRQDDGVTVDYVNSGEHDIWSRTYAYALQMTELMASNSTASATGDMDKDLYHVNNMKLRLLAAMVLPFAGHRVVRRDVAVPAFMLRESLKVSLSTGERAL